MREPQPERGGQTRQQRARRAATRLFVSIMAGCVILAVSLLGWAAWTLDRDLRQQAEQRINTTLDVLTEHTLKVFQTTEMVLYNISLLTRDLLTDEDVRAREASLHDAFMGMAHVLPEVQSIWLISRDGMPLATNLVVPAPPLDLTDREYFRALSTGDEETHVGPVIRSRMDGAPFFTVTRRRPSVDGNFNGIIDISLLPSDFEAFFRQLGAEGGALYYMVRVDGVVLAQFPKSANSPPQLNPKTSPLVHAMSTRPEGGLFTGRSLTDGQVRLMGYRKLGPYPVYLAVGITPASVRAEWLSRLTGYIAFGTLATLLLLIALAVAHRRTQRMYAEAEGRQTAEAALGRAQRLEAIGQLTGGVAHDFNNLLMVIQGSVERLRQRIQEQRDVRSLDMIETAVQRGAKLTRQLLTFSRRQALTVEVIDIAQHVGQFAEMLRRSLRGDIQTIVELPDNLCPVRVDPAELELALLNIGVNARDAMENGGRLWIRARAAILDGEAATDGLRGRFIAVSLTDSGMGISAEALPRVFDPFFTTKEIGKGTGLGLSQVYGFARQSGGAVTIASEPGRGTTVTLFLPCSPVPAAPSAGPSPRAPAAPEPVAPAMPALPARAFARRILLVDDSPELAEVSRGFLEDLGFDVVVTQTGQRAEDLIDAGERFDAVLSDIMMPGEMSGIDLARRLRCKAPTLPVLLTTGYSASMDDALRDGFAIITKPYGRDQLRDALEQAMRTSRVADRMI